LEISEVQEEKSGAKSKKHPNFGRWFPSLWRENCTGAFTNLTVHHSFLTLPIIKS